MKHFDSILYALGQLNEYVKDFFHNKKKIIQLDLAEQGVQILSKIIGRFIIFIFFIFFLLFGSITLSIGLSIYFNSFITGFGIVTALYLVLIGVVIVFRRPLITSPIVNMILKDFYN